ncbi:MAG: PCP reductase family protein [Cyanobacteria bacterium J06648_11]
MSDWTEPLEWSDEALAKLSSIPFFARSQARQYIEQLARDRDLEEITPEFVDEARKTFGN